MRLAPGEFLLHYRLAEKIGEGGMGVVWRARDTRLNRDVAIKVLPHEFSSDVRRLDRFEREARTLASLHHPNVASIFGLEEAGGERFLVMEMVEGEDLQQRLKRGSVPGDEALAIARQIAEGLEAAHEKGIVHRDLKPANVKLTPDGKVKVLDFGLARAFADEGEGASWDLSNSPTLTAPATKAGVIIGTAAYMSPEQARGRPVDRRADIWSFGCVLYEMLTGHRTFAGGSVSDTLAAVLRNEPDWSRLPEETTAKVAGLVKRCLRKDAKDRLRDIGDARLELADAISGVPDAAAPTRATPGLLRPWMWAAGGLLAGALIVAGLPQRSAPTPLAPELRKFSIPIPQLGVSWFAAPRISPDGHLVAYSSDRGLWVRDLRRFEATEIPGSEGGSSISWSPDSSQVAFAKEGRIWIWTLTERQSVFLCSAPEGGTANGSIWGGNGKIYFAVFRGGLYEVAAAGGEPRLLITHDPDEVDFHEPAILPDSAHLVVVTHRKAGPHQLIAVSVPDGARTTIASFDGLGTVVYSRTGHLILNFAGRQPRILAAPFSEEKLQIVGEPFLVAAGGQFPSVSSNGLMTYSLGSSSVQSELVWVDREGLVGQAVGRPRLGLESPAISPDGSKVAVAASENENADIWIQDLGRGTWRRLSSGPQADIAPIWSPSGDRLFYLRLEKNFFETLMEIPSDASGKPRALADRVESSPFSVSPDGRSIIFMREKEGRFNLWKLDLRTGSEPVLITPGATTSEGEPAISPDGRWLACASDDSGPTEIFVRPLAGGGQRQQVSFDGGSSPFWSRKGDSLFFWDSGALMEASVESGAYLKFGTPRKLFSAASLGIEPSLDVAADGRFLAVRRSNEDPRRGLLLVENWLEEFRKR